MVLIFDMFLTKNEMFNLMKVENYLRKFNQFNALVNIIKVFFVRKSI